MNNVTISQQGIEPSENFVQRLVDEVPIYAIALAVFAICSALLMSRGITPSFGAVNKNGRLFLSFAFILLVFDAAWKLNRHRPASPIEFVKPIWRVVANALPMLAIAILVVPIASGMKAAIPLFNDYTWDATFIQWDRTIFLGHDAWEVFQPVLGYPVVTALLALLYHLWFLLLYPGLLFFMFFRIDSQLRRQFFLTYMLCWAVIAGFMATLLASVGPCFVSPLLGDPHFDSQMAYLNSANEQIPIMTLRVQAMLLEWHDASSDGLGSGISAMPSMHCAIAFLYWIAMRRIDRKWGAAFGVFFFIIWIGSVHLAYHYAVDGLVSVAAVAALWWASGRIVKGWDAWVEKRGQLTFRTNTVPAE